MPRDPSSTPCEKAISEPHIHHISQVSISSYIRSGYKSGRPLPRTRYSNIFPAGCTTLPNTLDHSSRTHVSRVNARPRKINMSQTYLGSAERSPLVYILSTPGSWSHRPQHCGSLRAGWIPAPPRMASTIRLCRTTELHV